MYKTTKWTVATFCLAVVVFGYEAENAIQNNSTILGFIFYATLVIFFEKPQLCSTGEKRKFSLQMVQLYQSGKPRMDILNEYELSPSAFDRWVRQFKTSGSFREQDNRTPEEQELIRLRKENQQLRMENDILKQAALSMGRK